MLNLGVGVAVYNLFRRITLECGISAVHEACQDAVGLFSFGPAAIVR